MNIKNRKTLPALFALIFMIGIALAGCGASEDASGQADADSENENGSEEGQSGEEELSGELNLFIWSEYIPDSVLMNFEEEFGVKVNYNNFSSNEEMLAKVSIGNHGYDLIVAGDYSTEILRKQGMLEPINKENIPNFENVDEQYLDQEFDPGNEYSIPYMGTTAVIAINTEEVETSVSSYEDLFDPEFERSLVVLDDVRVLIGAANKMQGEPLNATDPDVLENSKQLLVDLAPNILSYDSDSPKTLLVNGEAKAGIVWGAEALLAEWENPAIQTVLPEEGMYWAVDNFMIPVGANNVKATEAFIDYILRPEVSLEISEDFPYTNPNKEAQELLDEDVRTHPAIFPPEEEMEKAEFAKDLGDAIEEYDRIWSEIKQ